MDYEYMENSIEVFCRANGNMTRKWDKTQQSLQQHESNNPCVGGKRKVNIENVEIYTNENISNVKNMKLVEYNVRSKYRWKNIINIFIIPKNCEWSWLGYKCG